MILILNESTNQDGRKSRPFIVLKAVIDLYELLTGYVALLPSFKAFFSLHFTPFFIHSHRRGSVASCTSAVKVKHQPSPIPSIMGLTTAVMPAPNKHLTRLAAALAAAARDR